MLVFIYVPQQNQKVTSEQYYVDNIAILLPSNLYRFGGIFTLWIAYTEKIAQEEAYEILGI